MTLPKVLQPWFLDGFTGYKPTKRKEKKDEKNADVYGIDVRHDTDDRDSEGR